jgi:3-deoxy-manno-octulosonate cytidylyltransferase (CMP-KDO synthetase)
VVVATHATRIFDLIRARRGEAMMTSEKCASGTDRVAEVAKKIRARLYLNIQGDEPLMTTRTVKSVLELHRKKGVVMGTAATVLPDAESWRNPNVVKVLVDNAEKAIYFSRASLPFFRDGAPKKVPAEVRKHLGIYSYEAALLRKFVRWPETFLERSERLEQLRALENGVSIQVAYTPDDSVGVDRPEDAKHVEKIFKKRFSL